MMLLYNYWPEVIGFYPVWPTSSLEGLFTMLKPSLSTLVDIDIELSIPDGDDDRDDDPFPGLCHELEKMVGQNVVETIRLQVWVLDRVYDCTRCGELDDVLMGSPEGWPALRKVCLSFHVSENSRDMSRRMKALRDLPMTKLVESKRVQFDFQAERF